MYEYDLAKLAPKKVWEIFEEITKIPRPSKKEEKIRSWIKNWAKGNKVVVKEEKVGNLLLSKKASKGKEKSPTLVLQGHLDMVCQMEPDSKSDCEKDSLIIQTDGKLVFAEGTSLGADNGIGMALGLAALIDEELEHGPLEVLLTVDEETGMTGALQMKKGFFTGDYLLNLDSEILGEITISSAGGDMILSPKNKSLVLECFSKLPRRIKRTFLKTISQNKHSRFITYQKCDVLISKRGINKPFIYSSMQVK